MKVARYESLDVFRGCACLSVVLFHSLMGYFYTEALEARVRESGGSWADWIVVISSRLWIGVPVFFVISGYCIAASADSLRDGAHPGLQFFIRRFRRIYPPLWAFLLITLVVIEILPYSMIPGPVDGTPPMPLPSEVLPWQWFGSVTLTEEWRYHVFGPGRCYFSGQLWTLCYEEQFYFVVGVIVLFARKRFFTAMAIISVLVYLNVFGISLKFGMLADIINEHRSPLAGFFFDGLWLAFAAGIAVYYRVNYASRLGRLALDCLNLLLLCEVIPWFTQLRLEGAPTIIAPACIFALILGWVHCRDAAIAKSRLTAPLAFCGRRCYSLYLIHAPVTAIVQWNLHQLGLNTSTQGVLIVLPIAVALSILLSDLFHRLVEKRFLNTRKL